jgi:hypothetical protein
MNTTVEGSNSADAYSPLDGGAGILLRGLELGMWDGVSTDIFAFFFLFFALIYSWIIMLPFLVVRLDAGFLSLHFPLFSLH